jgi:O-antigen ligase
MAGGLMAMTSLIRFARKPLIVHLLVAALVSVTFSALFLGAGGGALETMGRDSSLTGRTDIWSIVLSVARNPFLGTGFESFWLGDRLQSVWNGFGLHIQEAHNGYLEVYLNGGWVGVAMLAIIIMTGYRNIIRALRENQDASCLKLGLFVAGVLYSFTEAGFRMLSPIWLAFLLAVTAVPDATAPERLPSTDIESSRQSDGLEPHLGQMINLEPSGGV